MTIHSVNHVQLAFPAGREAEIRRFYTSLVGLVEPRLPPPVPGGTLRFRAGPQRIDLVPTENWQAPGPAFHLAFEVQDLPKLRRRLLAADLVLDESRPLVGHLRFYVKDPAGNPLEFLEPDDSQGQTV